MYFFFSRKSKKQRIKTVKVENSSFASDRSSDDQPLINLQTNQKEDLNIDHENSETSTDKAMPRKVNLKDLTDW